MLEILVMVGIFIWLALGTALCLHLLFGPEWIELSKESYKYTTPYDEVW